MSNPARAKSQKRKGELRRVKERKADEPERESKARGKSSSGSYNLMKYLELSVL